MFLACLPATRKCKSAASAISTGYYFYRDPWGAGKDCMLQLWDKYQNGCFTQVTTIGAICFSQGAVLYAIACETTLLYLQA